MKSRRQWNRTWIMIGLVWIGMAVATHLPPILGLGGPQDSIIGPDKAAHLLGFATLAFLLRRFLGLRAWLVLLIIALYGMTDEITQPPFGRTADPFDWIADMLGASVGLLVAIPFLRARRLHPADPATPPGTVADAVHPQS